MPDVLPVVPTSTEQAQLIEAGAKPVQPDLEAIVAELQKQIDAQNKHLEALLAEKGQSLDPVKTAVVNLTDHVVARAAALPQHDFSSLLNYLRSLPERVSSAESALVKELVTDVMEATGNHPELAYLVALARDLHKAVLSAGTVGA